MGREKTDQFEKQFPYEGGTQETITKSMRLNANAVFLLQSLATDKEMNFNEYMKLVVEEHFINLQKKPKLIQSGYMADGLDVKRQKCHRVIMYFRSLIKLFMPQLDILLHERNFDDDWHIQDCRHSVEWGLETSCVYNKVNENGKVIATYHYEYDAEKKLIDKSTGEGVNGEKQKTNK